MRRPFSLCLVAFVGWVASPQHAAGEGPQRSGTTHVIAAGDTLWDLAQAVGCRVDDVRRANGMTESSPLRVGDRLALPQCGGQTPSAKVHVVTAGDTLSAIAVQYGTTVDALRSQNGLSDTVIRLGQRITVGEMTPVLPLQVVTGQSVGRPQHGKLVDGVRLPHDPGYYRRRVERAWGAQHVVDFTRRAIAHVRTKYPSVHRLAIGDLSAKRGGSISGHASHQSGRDVDLGLYFDEMPAGYPQEFVSAHTGKLHRGATWELVLSLYNASKQAGGPEKIFLDYKVQGKLYEHAKKRGVSTKVLGAIFQYPDGRWAKERLVKHEPGHADHLHVRFACPADDATCD